MTEGTWNDFDSNFVDDLPTEPSERGMNSTCIISDAERDAQRSGLEYRIFVHNSAALRVVQDINVQPRTNLERKIACPDLFVCNNLPLCANDILCTTSVLSDDCDRVWDLHCKYPNFSVGIKDEATLNAYQAFCTNKLVHEIRNTEADPLSPSFIGAHRRLNVWLSLDSLHDTTTETLFPRQCFLNLVQQSRRLVFCGILLNVSQIIPASGDEAFQENTFIQNLEMVLPVFNSLQFEIPRFAMFSDIPLRNEFFNTIQKLLGSTKLCILMKLKSGLLDQVPDNH